MTKDRVERMLGLARLKREGCLSDAELSELQALRQEYLRDFREGFARQLEQVYLEQEDGSYKKLEKKKPSPKQ